MKKLRTVLQISLLLLTLSAVSVWAFAPTLNATAGNANIKAGTKIFFAVGGDGCNCTGAASALAGSTGSATVAIDLRGCHPNSKCVVSAGASDDSSGKKYKGRGSISTTMGGNYASTFSLSPY